VCRRVGKEGVVREKRKEKRGRYEVL